MSAKKSKPSNKKIVYSIIAIITVLLVAAGVKVYEDVLAGNINLPKGEKAFIYIYTNKSFAENMEVIRERGVMHNTTSFERLAQVTGYSDLVKPGRYEVTADVNNMELLRLMVSGRQTPVDVTFKQAKRNEDLAAYWGNQLEADSMELLALLNNAAFCDSLGFTTETIKSMFIPNTYNFYWTTSSRKLIARMHNEYLNFWTEQRKARLNAIGLSQQQVSTLAAIVQKETYRKDEMPVVAGVYINRLNKGMPLQADPTIIYALNNDTIKRVGGAMLEVESPYNTYKYKGLPPGPICVPGVAAIDAVLNYQRNNYIYFCAKEDFSGYHNFAATFAQHQVNARKYQQELNRRGVK